ncbi:MAG TPA: class I SAM-dependent methyltransferase [Thermoanaerobaculia bacterium]|nr:class I SAM-dependent methyltransferase [Thermoanaerobaculia bacterium]
MRHPERITQASRLPPWLDREHEARYAFCRALVTGRSVLDCGSGEGRGSRSIVEGKPRMMFAVDRAIDAVQRVPRTTNGRVRAVTASAEQLPLRRDSVEVVVALELIEHIDRPDALLHDVAAGLRSDGVFVCSTPNRIVRNPRTTLHSKPLNPWHVVEWTPDEFQSMLERFFTKVVLYGQSPQSRRTTRLFDTVAVVWRRGAAILRQAVKFRRSVVPTPRNFYDPRPIAEDADYEFIVAKCTGPRRA